jgi:hypothetical protein
MSVIICCELYFTALIIERFHGPRQNQKHKKYKNSREITMMYVKVGYS